MKRTLHAGPVVAALVALVVAAPVGAASPDPAAAATPAAGPGWTATWLGNVEREICVEWFGLSDCARSGGLAANGAAGTIVWENHLDSEFGNPDFAVYQRTDDEWVSSWTFPYPFVTGIDAPPATWNPAMSQLGTTLDVVYENVMGTKPIQVRRSSDLGAHWAPATRLRLPWMVTTNLAIDRGPGGVVAVAAAGWDEVSHPGDMQGIVVHVSTDGGATFPRSHQFGWRGAMCAPYGFDPQVAVTKGGVVVLAYWRTCSKLVVTRSKDAGQTWSAPVTLSTGTHDLGMSMASTGDKVVLAYTAGGSVLTRRSTDRGHTWSAPVTAGSGATSLRLAYAGGAWRLVAGGTDRVRYRSSSNGLGWSEGETVFESLGSRTYATGVAFGTVPQAAFVIRTPDKTWSLYVATR